MVGLFGDWLTWRFPRSPSAAGTSAPTPALKSLEGSPKVRPGGMSKYGRMSDHVDAPQNSPAGNTDLLTITEVAQGLGVSRRRVERLVQAGAVDTMRQERNGKAVHLIHRAVLPALKSRSADQPSGVPGGESNGESSLALTLLTERAEKAETRADAAELRERELRDDLVALANASGIRAWKLKKQLRQRLSA